MQPVPGELYKRSTYPAQRGGSRGHEARCNASDYSVSALDNARRDLVRFARWKKNAVVAECRRTDLIDFLLANPQWRSNHSKSRVLAVMVTAGLSDDSGKWLYHTGLQAKSGVGGGIIGVSPGKFGIVVVSPPLDDAGNSVRAQRAIADISNVLGGNPYAVPR